MLTKDIECLITSQNIVTSVVLKNFQRRYDMEIVWKSTKETEILKLELLLHTTFNNAISITTKSFALQKSILLVVPEAVGTDNVQIQDQYTVTYILPLPDFLNIPKIPLNLT